MPLTALNNAVLLMLFIGSLKLLLQLTKMILHVISEKSVILVRQMKMVFNVFSISENMLT